MTLAVGPRTCPTVGLDVDTRWESRVALDPFGACRCRHDRRRWRGRGARRRRRCGGWLHYLDWHRSAGGTEALERCAANGGEPHDAGGRQRDHQRRDEKQLVATASAPSGSDAFEPLEPKSLSVVPHRTGFDRNQDRCCCHGLPLLARRSRSAESMPNWRNRQLSVNLAVLSRPCLQPTWTFRRPGSIARRSGRLVGLRSPPLDRV